MRKEGYLLKRSRNGKWKKRYIIVNQQSLSYVNHPNDPSQTARGKISLDGASVILDISEQNNQKRFLTVTPLHGPAYVLQCEEGTEQENEWIETLRKVSKPNYARNNNGSNNSDWNTISLSRPATLSWAANSLSQWRQPLALTGIMGIQQDQDDRKPIPLTSIESHQIKLPGDSAFCSTLAAHNKHAMFCIAANGCETSLLATIVGADARVIARLQGLGGHWEQSSLGPSHLCWHDTSILIGTRNGKVAHYVVAENESNMRKDYAPTSTFQLPDAVLPVRKVLLNPLVSNQFCTLAGRAISLWDLSSSSSSASSAPCSTPLVSELASSADLYAGAWNMHAPNELVLGTANGTLKLLDTRILREPPGADCALWRVSKAHGNLIVRDVKWSPSVPHWFASGGDDGVVKIWDLRMGNQSVREFTSHLNSVSSVAWSKSHCELLASVGADACLKLWNMTLSPHYVAHTEKHDKIRWREGGLVGCEFSSTSPATCYTVSGVGQISTIDMRQIISLQCPKIDHSSEKSVSNMQSESIIRTKMYLRDESAAYELISNLAEKYARCNRWEWAAALLDLAQPVFSQTVTQNVPASLEEFNQLVDRLSRLIPPNTPKQTTVDQKTTNKLQSLHLRVALITYLSKGQWEKLLELEQHICNQLQNRISEQSDKKEVVVDSSVLQKIIIAIAEKDPSKALLFALNMSKPLKQGGTTWNYLLTTCQYLISPTIYGKLDLYEDQRAKGIDDSSSEEEDDDTPHTPLSVDETKNNNVTTKDNAKTSTQVEKDIRLNLDKHLRNPTFVINQLTLFARVCAAVPTFLPFGVYKDAWFTIKPDSSIPQAMRDFVVTMNNEQAQNVMEMCEKQGIQEQRLIQDQKTILPANIYRVYYSALLQLKNYDKLFILATQLIHGLKQQQTDGGAPFAAIIGAFIDLVFERFKLFLDKAFTNDTKTPWRTGTKTAACLTIVNIMYNCPFLPLCLQKCLPDSLWTLTQQLSVALQETCRNPGFKASAKGATADCAEIAAGILQQLRRIQDLKPATLEPKDTPRGVNDLVKMLTSYAQTK